LLAKCKFHGGISIARSADSRLDFSCLIGRKITPKSATQLAPTVVGHLKKDLDEN